METFVIGWVIGYLLTMYISLRQDVSNTTPTKFGLFLMSTLFLTYPLLLIWEIWMLTTEE